jgi:hypothetical protein
VQSERLNRITINDAQCGGRPCIRGMRIRVTDVLELLGAGANFEEILEDIRIWNARTFSPQLSMLLVKRIIRFCDRRELSCRQSATACTSSFYLRLSSSRAPYRLLMPDCEMRRMRNFGGMFRRAIRFSYRKMRIS